MRHEVTSASVLTMDASHTLLLLLLLGWPALWQPAVNAQAWRSAPTKPPKGGERLDPLHSVVPLVRFACRGRTEGYYGDMDFGCTVFHYCTDDGKRFSFKCDEGLKFNEVTTSCSAGYFGDCAHSGLVSPIGRNRSTEPITAHSFVKLPGFIRKAEEEGVGKPGDYPQPFIQRDDPARDATYNYDTNDQEPGSSNTVAKNNNNSNNNNIKRSSFQRRLDSPMMSALSAFASLANVPLDNAMLSKGRRDDRSGDIDRLDSFDTVDRAFFAQPPPHRRTPHKQREGGFFQLPFFQPETKKGRVVPHHAPPRAQSIVKTHHWRPHPRPDAHDPYVEAPPLHQLPPERYPGDADYDAFNDGRYDSAPSKTTANSFQPSSLLSGGSEDDFRPVTEPSRSPPAHEADDLARPHRDAQGGGGATSTTFQSFSPVSHQSPATGFPGQNTFNRPAQEAPTGFLADPRFPSTGSFLFHQPPVPTLVTNRPFHHVLPSGTGFRGTPASELQNQGSFGFHPQSQPGHTIVRQTLSPHSPFFGHQPQPQATPNLSQLSTQTFGQPQAPKPVQSFSFPKPRQPQSPPSIFEQGFTTQPSVFNHGLTTPSAAPQPVHTFGRPSTPPHPLNVFNLAAIPLHTPSDFGRPPPGSSVSQSGTPAHNAFGVSSPAPVIATIPNPRDGFSFGNTELQQENPLGQEDTQQKQLERASAPGRRPAEPSTSDLLPFSGSRDTSRSPQNPSRLPDSRSEDTTSTPGNPDPLESFGWPLKNRSRGRPFGRPLEGERQSTTHKLDTPSTEQPVGRRPSRTRQPSQPFDTTHSHTSQQQELPPVTQPDGRQPEVPRLRPQLVPQEAEEDPFLHAMPFNPHTPEPFSRFPGAINRQPEEKFQQSPDVFDIPTGVGISADSPRHLANDIHPELDFGNPSRGVQGEGLSTVEDVEEDTNVILPAEGNPLNVPDKEASTPTYLPLPDTTDNTQLHRRRPGIRTRLRSRPSSRTTTSPPDSFQSENPAQGDYDYSDEPLATTQTPATEETPTTSTGFTPFRQRIRDRLNRLKNRRRESLASRNTTTPLTSERNSSRGTTRQPIAANEGIDHFTPTQRDSDDKPDSDQVTTTVLPRRRLLRPRGFDRDKFQNFRNKLRNRISSRVTTTETSENEEHTTIIPETAKEEEPPTEGRTRRLNRFRPRPAESGGESVLVVKEILRSSDQETQETTRLEVSENPELGKIWGQPGRRDSTATEEVFGDRKDAEGSITDLQEDGEDSQLASKGADEPVEHGFQGRRLVDPNFRERFREFLKNRKDKLSARYRATEDFGEHKEQKGYEDATEEQPHMNSKQDQRTGVTGQTNSRHDTESRLQDGAGSQKQQEQQQQAHQVALSEVMKERAERFEQRRKELLARRGEERLSRRIPSRPFRNKVPDQASTKNGEQLSPHDEQGALPSERQQDPEEEKQPFESSVQKVISIDGFRPIIETPPAPPTPTHPKPIQEPEIITAPPAPEEEDTVMLIKVSAGFGGKENQQGVTGVPLASLPHPSTMIVREITIKPSTIPEPLTPTFEVTTPESLSQDTLAEDSTEPQNASESQHAPVLLSVQMVPEKASLHPPEALPFTPATTTKTEPHPPSSTTPTENEAASSLAPTHTTRPYRPSFSLAAASGRLSSQDKEEQEASDRAAGMPVTPRPQLAITMATDRPFLPLEMLLPLSISR